MNDDRISIGRLIAYLREKKRLIPVFLSLILGICLLMFGSGCSDTFSAKLSKTNLSKQETRFSALCSSVHGVGKADVLLNCRENGCITGVIIVCEGGDSPDIQLKLTNLVCAYFGLTSDSVSVVGGK